MTSALIVDDEEDVRFLLRQVIQTANNGLFVSDEAATGEEALVKWAAHRPNVIVLDNGMPGASGLDVAEKILREHPEQSIILFTAHLDRETVRRAKALGVRACLAKDDYNQIPDAIRLHAGPAA